MARTSKMNMIMHGDGHGGVHHWNGFLNVNGIFDGRFNIILTNPPFGAHVESSALVEVPDAEDREWQESKRRYAREYGDLYRNAVARVEAAKGKPIASLFELPKRAENGADTRKLGKIKTELLFIERCLDLLAPGGRLGIVLPEGVFNNPSLGRRPRIRRRPRLSPRRHQPPAGHLRQHRRQRQSLHPLPSEVHRQGANEIRPPPSRCALRDRGQIPARD